MGERLQTCMNKLRAAPRHGRSRIAPNIRTSPRCGRLGGLALLCAHVWTLVKCLQMLMRAWPLQPLDSLFIHTVLIAPVIYIICESGNIYESGAEFSC